MNASCGCIAKTKQCVDIASESGCWEMEIKTQCRLRCILSFMMRCLCSGFGEDFSLKVDQVYIFVMVGVFYCSSNNVLSYHCI